MEEAKEYRNSRKKISGNRLSLDIVNNHIPLESQAAEDESPSRLKRLYHKKNMHSQHFTVPGEKEIVDVAYNSGVHIVIKDTPFYKDSEKIEKILFLESMKLVEARFIQKIGGQGEKWIESKQQEINQIKTIRDCHAARERFEKLLSELLGENERDAFFVEQRCKRQVLLEACQKEVNLVQEAYCIQITHGNSFPSHDELASYQDQYTKNIRYSIERLFSEQDMYTQNWTTRIWNILLMIPIFGTFLGLARRHGFFCTSQLPEFSEQAMGISSQTFFCYQEDPFKAEAVKGLQKIEATRLKEGGDFNQLRVC